MTSMPDLTPLVPTVAGAVVTYKVAEMAVRPMGSSRPARQTARKPAKRKASKPAKPRKKRGRAFKARR